MDGLGWIPVILLVFVILLLATVFREVQEDNDRRVRQRKHFAQLKHNDNASFAHARRQREVQVRKAAVAKVATEKAQADEAQRAEWYIMVRLFFNKRGK